MKCIWIIGWFDLLQGRDSASVEIERRVKLRWSQNILAFFRGKRSSSTIYSGRRAYGKTTNRMRTSPSVGTSISTRRCQRQSPDIRNKLKATLGAAGFVGREHDYCAILIFPDCFKLVMIQIVMIQNFSRITSRSRRIDVQVDDVRDKFVFIL